MPSKKKITVVGNTANPAALSAARKFQLMDRFVNRCFWTAARSRGAIVSGRPGIGKSWTLRRAFADVKGKRIVWRKGRITGFQLYSFLFAHCQKDDVVVFDDCDDVFNQIDAMNVLKAATDAETGYRVNWVSMAAPVDEFVFEGKVLVLTNYKLRSSPHFSALTDRVREFHIELNQDEVKAHIHSYADQAFVDTPISAATVKLVLDWIDEVNIEMMTFQVFNDACWTAHEFPQDWPDMLEFTMPV